MRIKKSSLLPRMFFVCSLLILLLPCFSSGEIVFEDNFDDQPDWSPTQTNSFKLCWNGNSCSPIPDNWFYWTQGGSVLANPPGENTININSSNYRGSQGKGFTIWHEGSGGVSGYQTDGILGNYFGASGYDELYIRFFAKFDPNFKWASSEEGEFKFVRTSHFRNSGNPSKYLPPEETQHPISFLVILAKGPGEDLRVRQTWRYEVAYFPNNATPYHNKFESNTISGCTWNEAGCPGDGNWHSWEVYVKLNSACGVPDGESKVWFDGNLVAEYTDLAYGDEGCQASPRLKFNHIALNGNQYNRYSNYTNNDEQWYAIDDVVVSTSYIGPDYVIGCEDSDSDGYNSSLCGGLDCDDSNAQVNPGKAEVCDNALDDDCDGSTDCDDSDCFFYSPAQCLDSDGDGYGNPASVTCTYPALDCNDSNGSTNPGATDVCGNGVDENCDGSDSVCPTTLSVGNRVETTMDLTVWSMHSFITGDLLGTQPTGSLGTLTSGPQDWEGDVWWQVDYDNVPDGWSVEDGLQLYTPPSGDSEPPSVPQSLQATAISTSRIDLIWSAATDNVGVVGYKIYRDGVQITTSLTTSYSDFGLQENTTYSYDVSAYDAAGNEGANSSSIQAATLEQPDTDGDGIRNICDNCTVDSNPGQEDTDGDGIGDACDPDDDNDNLTDDDEINIYGTNPLLFDTDADGYGDGDEVALLSDPLDSLSIPEFATGDIAPRGAPDGVVDVADTMLAMRIAMGLISPTQLDTARGDVAPLGGPDGVIDIADVLLIFRKAAGLVSF